MAFEQYTQLLKQLESDTGIQGLSFNEMGECVFLVNNSLAVTVKARADETWVSLSAMIASELPDPAPQQFFEDLLKIALYPMSSSSPIIGMDEETEALIAYQNIPMSRELLNGTFPVMVNEFIAFCILSVKAVAAVANGNSVTALSNIKQEIGEGAVRA